MCSTNCNKLWLLPNDKSSSSWLGDDGESMLPPHIVNNTVSEAILSAQRNLKNFWDENQFHFTEFWTAMRHQSRENFVRTVHPTIVQSLRDRYCIREGTRIYEDRYERELLLAPKMTVEGLISGTYLIQLIETLVDLETIQSRCNKTVLDLRRLNKYKKFQLSDTEKVQRENETSPQIGQTFIVQGGPTFGMKIAVHDSDILNQIVAEEHSLYKLGKLSYAYEFDIVSSNIYFIYTMIARLLDEFRKKVLQPIESNTKSLLDIVAMCGYCSKEGGEEIVLKQCKQCMSVHYCST